VTAVNRTDSRMSLSIVYPPSILQKNDV